MNQKQPDTFSRMKTLIYRRLFATIIIMAYVAPLISTLNFPPSKLPISAVSSATVEGCAGMRARYICDIDNPSMFHICLGNKRFTMICPGELHFSERTQTCDWPEVANCRRLSRFQQSEPAPLLGFYNSTVTLSEVDSPPYKVAYDFEGENPQDITLATLGYSDDIKIESEISSTRLPTPGYENKVKANVSARIQGHAKRRRGNWKYSKALDRNSPLSRWWNNPVVTPAIPLSTAAPKLVGSDTKHVAGFAQPFKARISPQTSSVLGLYMPEESKLSKVPSEDYVQRKPIENKVKPIPKSYRSSVRAPWYRANKSKVNAHSDFSPSRSFKTRTSRESRLKPRKPVVISPFSPFTRGPVETENRGHNNKFQKNPSGSDRFSEEAHSRPNETPMSQRNQNLLNKHEESFDSPNSDFLENVKHGSIQSRRDIYSNDQGVSHMTSKMNESPGKDRPHLARDHVSLTFPEGRKFEKNTQLEPVSKPQAVAELGSLALPPVTNKLEVKQSEGGRFVNQQSSKYSSSLQYSYPKENSENSANRESKPQRGSPYTSEVSNLQKESPNLQKESPRVVITNRAIQASATQPEPVMYSDWTSIHGVAGIPDYNPAQAVGFFSSKNRNIHNKASTNNLEKQIASSNSRSSHSRVTINSSEKQTASIRDNRMRSERQIAGPKDQLDRDVYGFSSGSKQEHQSPGQEILQRKRFNPNDELLSPTQITKMNRHNSNKATTLRGTDLSLVKHGYKSKENSDKLVLHRGHKDNTVNRVTAAASKNGIRAMKHRNRERRRDRKSRSSPKPRTLKKTNAFSQRADPYSFRHRSTNRQQPHDPLMLRYEGMAQKEATFGPVAPKRHSLKPSRFKNDESYSKGITDSRYRDYSRRTSSLQEKRRSDNLIDTSRYAVLKVDEPFVNSAVTQASLHGANEVSIVPKQRSTGRELVTKVPKEIMQEQYNIRVTKNSKEPVYPVSASNQRPVMHSADGRMSRFTQRPVILSQATHQSGSHLPEAQSYARASKAEKPAQHQALRVSRNQLDDPLYRRNIQEPPNYYTRPPPSGFSHVTRAQSPSNIENRARSQPSGRASSRSSGRSSSKFSDTASRRAKQESYPVTLNYNLHGLSGPKRSERTYALHKPNHKNLNRIHLPVETKDISQYSLYGLRENSKTSVREGLLEPVALKDSRYKLRGVNDRAMKSEDLTPRTSPIEKYKISRGNVKMFPCIVELIVKVFSTCFVLSPPPPPFFLGGGGGG